MIKIENICKSIGKVEILRDINLNIKRGEIFSLIGPNGAGKTTLIRLVLDLYNPTNGEIKIRDEAKGNIGFLLDNIGLFKNLTAWQNMEFFDRIYYPNDHRVIRENRIEKLINMVGLTEHSRSKITFFSRGMKQRLCIARALINNPDILILDEPLRGLDLDGQILLRNILLNLKKEGCTIFINSHNMDLVQKIADHIAFIKGGRILEDGNINSLMKKYRLNSVEDLYEEIIGI